MNKRARDEKGAVFFLLAIMLPVLIGMLTLALDFSHLGELKNKSRAAARLGALAAVEGLNRSGPVLEPSGKMCYVLKYVRDTIAKNSYLKGSATGNVTPRIEPTAVIPDCDAPMDPSSTEAAKLEPGMWHRSRPETPFLGESDPCNGKYPCFQSYDFVNNPQYVGTGADPTSTDGEVSAIFPNSFRLRGKIFSDVKFYFADKIFSQGVGASMQASATSLVTPRRLVFSIDTSPSMIRDNYLRRPLDVDGSTNDQADTPANGHGAEYVYFLTQNIPNCTTAPNSAFAGSDKNDNEAWKLMCGHGNYKDKISPNKPPPNAINPDGDWIPQPLTLSDVRTSCPWVHFPNEFTRKAVLNDTDYSESRYKGLHPDPSKRSAWGTSYAVGTDRQFFLVDTDKDKVYRAGVKYTCANGASTYAYDTYGYYPPQPLGNILEALNSMVWRMRSTLVSGDKIGFTFFDSRFLWPRVIYPTSNFEYLGDFVYAPYSPTSAANQIQDDSLTISSAELTADPSTSTAPGAKLERIIRHHIFPEPAADSDYISAVLEALSQLNWAKKQNGNQDALEGVVLVGDGLSTCCLPNAPSDWPAGEKFGSANKGSICNPRCNNRYANWNEAMLQLEDIVRVRMVPNNIPLHVMLVGNQVAPHVIEMQTVDPVTGEKRCLTENEARRQGIRRVLNSRVAGGGRPTTEAQWDTLFRYRSNNLAPNMTTDTGPFLEAGAKMYDLARISKGKWLPIRPWAASGTANPYVYPAGPYSPPPAPYSNTPVSRPSCVDATTPKAYLADPPFNTASDLLDVLPYSIVE